MYWGDPKSLLSTMYAVQGFQKIKMCEMIRSVKYVFNFMGKKTPTRSYTGTSPVLPSPKLTVRAWKWLE